MKTYAIMLGLLASVAASSGAQELRLRYISSQTALSNLYTGNSQRGGRRIEVNGYGFKPGVTIRLGDSFASNLVTLVRYADGSDSIFGVSPSHSVGWVDVIATNPDGTSSKLERAFLFTPVGDTNGDGVVSAVDLVRLVGILTAGTLDNGNGDVTEDGRVDSGDLRHLADFLFADGPEPLFAPPRINSFEAVPESVPFGGSSVLRFTIERAPSWTINSALGNSLTPSEGSGSATVTYRRDKTDGSDIVILTASGTSGLSTQALNLRCPGVSIFSLTVTPPDLRRGGMATVQFSTAQSTRWSLRSSLSNAFDIAAGVGEGTFTATYTATRSGGDTVTLTAEGKCGPAMLSAAVSVAP
jgi:hypothetical protein